MTTQVKYQDRTVTANGLKIHYLEWGDPSAPPLVALHGLRGHGHTWDSFSEPLSSQYHIFALDQRGRGDTDWAPDGQYTGDAFVADFEGFVDALGLDNFVLMGHSMGGRNSMLYAGKHPEKVRKLILVDIGPEGDPRGGARIRSEMINAKEEYDSFEQLIEAQQNSTPTRAAAYGGDVCIGQRYALGRTACPFGKPVIHQRDDILVSGGPAEVVELVWVVSQIKQHGAKAALSVDELPALIGHHEQAGIANFDTKIRTHRGGRIIVFADRIIAPWCGVNAVQKRHYTNGH